MCGTVEGQGVMSHDTIGGQGVMSHDTVEGQGVMSHDLICMDKLSRCFTVGHMCS